MSQKIRVYHTGRIAHEPHPKAAVPTGMIWSRDMRFFFTHVPAGTYTLEVLLKETTRVDAGGGGGEQPAVNIYINNRLAAERVAACAPKPEDPYAVCSLPVTVDGAGFDVRLYGVQGGLTLPCLYGMRLKQGNTVVYDFTVGDARERAMWKPSELSMEEGTTVCREYEALLHSGVPLGGIGTGRLELLTNGTLGSFSLCNNWDVPTYWTEGSFFALWFRHAGQSKACILHPPRTAGGFGLPTAKAVRYHGRYPVADLAYDLDDSPVEVTLRAQGSLVPGEMDLSMLPAATFTFQVRNRTEAAVEVALLASLENLAGQGGYYFVKHDWSSNLRDRFDSADGARNTSLDHGKLHGFLFDNSHAMEFERIRPPPTSSVTESVKAAGEAGYTVKTEGSGGAESIHRPLARRNTFSRIILAAEGDGVSRCVWDTAARIPSFWECFARDGRLSGGEGVVGVGDVRPAAAVARTLTISPGETAEVVFVLAWHHKGHVTFRDGVDHGHAYQAKYRNVQAVAAAASSGRRLRARLVDRFQSMIKDSTLPGWLQTKLINGAFPTTTNTVWTADNLFSVHESPADMAGAIGTLDQRMAAHPFLFAMFPELDRLELDWFRRCQVADGQLPHMIGNLYDKLGCTEAFFCITGWPDLSCSFVFQTYRHYLYTGDREWLARNFDSYIKAIHWILSTDKFGLGLPVGGHTYDYDAAEWQEGAPMIFNAVNFLGALRVAMEAARRLGRDDLISEWQVAFDKAHASLMTHFWNGKYFRKWVHPEKSKANENCFVAQLAGDWFVRLLGLPPLFTDQVCRSVLDSIVELNMLPHNPAIVMEALPNGEAARDSGYIQQHEPYLGMNLIYHGRVQRGLEVMRRRQEITWHVNSNPWGESLATQTPSGWECALFDYMTSPATWNVLYALTGCTVDAARGVLRFAPQMDGARRLRLPVFIQHLWLVLDVDLDRAEPVRIKVVRTPPNGSGITTVEIQLPGQKTLSLPLCHG